MCSYIVEKTALVGSARGRKGWMRIDTANVYFDHPYHSTLDHVLAIDFTNEGEGGRDRVAVELSADSACAIGGAYPCRARQRRSGTWRDSASRRFSGRGGLSAAAITAPWGVREGTGDETGSLSVGNYLRDCRDRIFHQGGRLVTALHARLRGGFGAHPHHARPRRCHRGGGSFHHWMGCGPLAGVSSAPRLYWIAVSA